jgi:spermidine synthase
LPHLDQTLVELRAIVLNAAQTYFNLPNGSHIHPIVANAIDYIAQTSTLFNIILVDLYDEKGMPPDCATPKFLTHLLNHLKPPGLAIFNLWEEDHEGVKAMMDFWTQESNENSNIKVQSYLIASSGNIILAIQIK